MIIKSLFKRYERWNPVHPTLGAFWGIGLGLGCGIGWGPGFGPEAIGHVGAGCGVGLSVGFTFLGLGIGLPTNSLLTVPLNGLMATKRSFSDMARDRGFVGHGNSPSHIGYAKQQNPFTLFSDFKIGELMPKRS